MSKSPPPRFFVHCNSTRSIYTLARKGETWRKEFNCMLGALLHASSIVKEETPATMLGEFGVAFLDRMIIPNRD
jgi:hypothetical protein